MTIALAASQEALNQSIIADIAHAQQNELPRTIADMTNYVAAAAAAADRVADALAQDSGVTTDGAGTEPAASNVSNASSDPDYTIFS